MKQSTHQKIIEYHKILLLEKNFLNLYSWNNSLLTLDNYFYPKKADLEHFLLRQRKDFSTFQQDFHQISDKVINEISEFKRAPVYNRL